MGSSKKIRGIAPILLVAAAFGSMSAARSDAAATRPAYSYYSIGKVDAPRPAKTEGAMLLSGGGDWDTDAFRWFAARAGHGHIVMIGTYGGGEDGEQFFRDIGGVASVETLEFNSREASFDPKVLAILAHADGIFIQGGDQSKYVRYWKGTPVARLINRHIRSGKPVGGTSAGLAIMGGEGYGAMDGGSIDSASALRDPAGPAVTIVDDFLHMPFLAEVITDTHFTARDRLGRLIAFVAKVRARSDPDAIGLGIDQDGALCVDARGIGHFFTKSGGFAWLIQPMERTRLHPGAPLDNFRVRITGIGPASTIDLRGMWVSRPAFHKEVRVKAGVLDDVASRLPSR